MKVGSGRARIVCASQRSADRSVSRLGSRVVGRVVGALYVACSRAASLVRVWRCRRRRCTPSRLRRCAHRLRSTQSSMSSSARHAPPRSTRGARTRTQAHTRTRLCAPTRTRTHARARPSDARVANADLRRTGALMEPRRAEPSRAAPSWARKAVPGSLHGLNARVFTALPYPRNMCLHPLFMTLYVPCP